MVELEQRKWKEEMLKQALILPGEKVLLGFSGGGDSVALCHLLCELRREMAFSLELIYIQHGLRGEESKREESFVHKWAERMNCPLTAVEVDVRGYSARRKLSLETSARELRRAAILERFEDGAFDKIVLAHHANDQAETILMNFLRGSGIAGLGGMRERREIWIRPLLKYPKTAILEYLKKWNLSWCEDSSNQSFDFRRNRVRGELIPYLEANFNPNLIKTLGSNAEHIKDLEDYLQAACRARYEALARREEGMIVFEIEALQREARYMQQALIRLALCELKGDFLNLEQSHIRRVLSLPEKESGKQVNIVGEWMAIRQYQSLKIGRRQALKEPGEALFFPLRLDICGQKRYIKIIKDFIFLVNPDARTRRRPSPREWTQNFDREAFPKDLVFRYALPEDYIIINSQGNHKLLKAVLAEKKLPKEKRTSVPVLASGNEIIWAPGYRMAYPYRVTEKTKHILQLTILGRTVRCQRLKKEFQEKQ